MAWFKVDDGFHSSRKLMSIPKRHRLAAAGLWVISGSWSADELTDGHVPDFMLKQWGATPSAVQALLDSGLWEAVDGDVFFSNWLEYQPSKKDIDAEREASRERMRELRSRRKQPKKQDSDQTRSKLDAKSSKTRRKVEQDSKQSRSKLDQDSTQSRSKLEEEEPLDIAVSGELFGRTVTNCSENVRNPDPTRPDPTYKRLNTFDQSEIDRAPISRFDEFWKIYPRKVGKQKAKTKYATQAKKFGEQIIIDGAARLARDPNLPEPNFIPHPTTWLERGGWDDDPLPPRSRDTDSQATKNLREVQSWGEPAPEPDWLQIERGY